MFWKETDEGYMDVTKTDAQADRFYAITIAPYKGTIIHSYSKDDNGKVILNNGQPTDNMQVLATILDPFIHELGHLYFEWIFNEGIKDSIVLEGKFDTETWYNDKTGSSKYSINYGKIPVTSKIYSLLFKADDNNENNIFNLEEKLYKDFKLKFDKYSEFYADIVQNRFAPLIEEVDLEGINKVKSVIVRYYNNYDVMGHSSYIDWFEDCFLTGIDSYELTEDPYNNQFKNYQIFKNK